MSEADFEIREARPEDVPAIAAMIRALDIGARIDLYRQRAFRFDAADRRTGHLDADVLRQRR